MEAILKTTVESGKWNINSIENQIKEYAFNNNLEVIQLESVKTDLIMKKLYINIKGEVSKLEVIKSYLHKIAFDLNN